MRKRCLLILAVVCGFLVPFSAVADLSTGAGYVGQPPGYVPGEALVKFRAETRDAGLQGYRQGWNIQPRQRFRSIGVDHLRLPEGLSVEEALEVFRSDPAVIYAEPNYYRYVAAVVPDDEHFGLLWGMHNTGQEVNETAGTEDADIDAPEAWEVTTGSADVDVVVAVIDSGLDFTHPDLSGNVWVNPDEIPGNGIDDDGNGYVDDVLGWDFINDDNAWDPVNDVPYPNDAGGHGTHVAGTIAAAGTIDSTGSAGTGVVGVSWHAKIMSLRTFNAFGAGDTAAAILAFEYANAMGADIINCSWGGTGYSQALKDVIDASSSLVVCAAGNSGADADALPHYPASYDSPNIISVAATDATDILAAFSNYGSVSVDVAAPGVNIYSCAPGRRALWTDDFDDGTIQDWKSGGPNNDWGLTTEQAVSAPWSLADSPDGNYGQRTNSWIKKQAALDLSNSRNTRFEFKLKGRSEAGYDFLKVEVSTDGSVWIWRPVKLSGIGIVPWVSGTIPEWTDALVDLSAYDGAPEFYVRFAFLSDWTNNFDGWYIDDVAVTAASSSYDGSEYRFLNGTSMAAPHVSGAAALVKAENPLLSAADIKAIIAGTIDPVTALDGVLASGGRLNAFGAVTAPDSGILQFGAAAYAVQENGGSVTITVTRTGGSQGAVSVNYASSDGTAGAGADYTGVSGTLTWDDGDDQPKPFEVQVTDDSDFESGETVVLTLSDPQNGAILGSPSTATLTILDDDYRPGTLQFNPAAYTAAENGGSVTITVTRTDGSDGAVSVGYASSGGTAGAGSDYTAVSGTLIWEAGNDQPKTFEVQVIDDTALEEDETVALTLSNPLGGATLGPATGAVVTIVDNDSQIPGTVEFSAPDYTVAENGVSAVVTVTRMDGSDGAVSVIYAASDGTATLGADYTETGGTLSWADGESGAKTFTVAIIDDDLYEPDETVNLTLEAPTGGLKLGEQSTAVLTILEEDPANDAPVANADSYDTDEGSLLAVSAPGVLANDTDADSIGLTAVLGAGPIYAAEFTLNSDGSFSYRHDGSETTSDSFTYTASDGNTASAPATVSITVNAVNDAPVAADDSASTPEDTAVKISVLANDSDGEGNTLSVVWVGSPSNGTAEINSDDNSIAYTPAADFNGSDSFSYTVSDGRGGSDTATVSITVTPVNDAPLADAGFDKTVIFGSTVTLDGRASSDIEGDALTFGWTFVARPDGSNSTIDTPDPGNPISTFVPDVPGIYMAQLIVNDGTADSVPALVTITADLDSDNDGVPQSLDNCTLVANPDQRDTDGDGYGNLCDGDLNNEASTNTLDLQIYKLAHLTDSNDPGYNPDADFNGDGLIDELDLDILKDFYRRPPGPSCCGD